MSLLRGECEVGKYVNNMVVRRWKYDPKFPDVAGFPTFYKTDKLRMTGLQIGQGGEYNIR